ncbi:cytochrome P450 [Myxococcota bacterium]|nr:cytochrome P450 [Myxococcota bacterium]
MSSTEIPIYDDLPVNPDEIFEAIIDHEKRGQNLVRLCHQLRNLAPVYQSPLEWMSKPWILTRYEDVTFAARQRGLVKDERLIDQLGGRPDSPYKTLMKRMMAFIPPPRHTRLRQLVNQGFTLRSVEALRPGVRKHVEQLIDDRIDAGEMDLVSDYAFQVPMAVICELLGVDFEDVPRVRAWARTVSRRGDESVVTTPDLEVEGDEAILGFRDFFQELIEARRREPKEDLISRLVAVQRDARDLSDLDIIAAALLIFQAGHDTTANMIGKGALALIQNPGQARMLREDPGRVPHATEELLRFDTSVQLTVNYAVEDLSFHGRTIRNGDAVILMRGAANRDPGRFSDPDRLDIERKDVQHHAFGLGAHFCLGASLARLEIQEALLALVTRLPPLRLEVDEPVYKPQLHVHGLEALPVSW